MYMGMREVSIPASMASLMLMMLAPSTAGIEIRNENLTAKIEEVVKSRGESLLPYWKKIQDLEARVAALEAELAKKSE